MRLMLGRAKKAALRRLLATDGAPNVGKSNAPAPSVGESSDGSSSDDSNSEDDVDRAPASLRARSKFKEEKFVTEEVIHLLEKQDESFTSIVNFGKTGYVQWSNLQNSHSGTVDAQVLVESALDTPEDDYVVQTALPIPGSQCLTFLERVRFL